MDGLTPAAAPAITDAGVYDIPDGQYHADQLCAVPSLSSSLCKVLIDETPRHAWMAHPRLNPSFEPENRETYDAGRAAHAAILDQLDLIAAIDATDYRTNAAKAARDAAREAGRIPVLAHKLAEIHRMARAVRSQILVHEEFPYAFSNGRAEQTLVWFEGDGADRIACRARLDWLPARGGVFFDLKTTGQNVGRDWPRRTLFDTGADIQAAFYLRGVRAVLGIERPTFVFVAVENYEPHCLMMHTLEPETLAKAEQKVESAIRWWRWCMKHGAWPAYPPRTNWVQAPPWEMARADELGHARPDDDTDAQRALLRACEAWQAPHEEPPAP